MMIGHFKIHYWLGWLFAVAFAGALYPRSDPQIVFFATLIISVFNFLALRLSWKNRDNIERLKRLSDYVAIFGMLAFIIILFVSGLLGGLIWFIAFIQLALNLTFKNGRHYYFGLLVTFALLSVGAAEAKTGFYLFYIIAYCAVASISLGYYFMDRRLQRNHGTHQHLSWPVWHRAQVIISLIMLSFIIYLITPRFETGNLGGVYATAEQYYSDKSWEQQADNQQQNDKTSDGGAAQESSSDDSEEDKGEEDIYAYRGFLDSFDVRGEQQQGGIPPNVIVAYMQAKHGAYLKVESFDLFDGIRWSKSLATDIKKKLQYGRITLQKNLTGNYIQSISIEENLGPYIPAAAIPVQLTFPSTVISTDAYEMIKIPSGLTKGTHYSVNSSVKFIEGRFFSGNHYQPRQNDLQLPLDFDPRIRALAEKITQSAQSELEKARLLEKHLRENYDYSYTSIFTSQNNTPVANFLFEDKKGHCEYFASSMAVMLRSLGIHSRLITGFSAMVENPLSGYYEIRVLDGHAWVEAWVDGIGWAVFEATPFYMPPLQDDEISSLEKIQQYVEQLRKIQEESGAETELSVENILTSIWHALSVLLVVVFGLLKLYILQFWKLLISLVVVGIMLVILREWWQPAIMKQLSYFKVQVYTPKGHESAVHFYMQQIQIIMRLQGTKRRAGTTIEQYAFDVKSGLDEADIKNIIELVNHRYDDKEIINELDPKLLKEIFIKLYRSH